MPYLKQEDREKFYPLFDSLDEVKINNPGDLNYLFSSIIGDYLIKQGLSYSSINEAIGVLECIKLELYRRIAEPYEELKTEQNGDIREYDVLDTDIFSTERSHPISEY